MPEEVQRLIGAAEKMERVGILPNGDRIYLITGLTSTHPKTAPQDLGNGVVVTEIAYATDDALLLYSSHFARWDVLAFNPCMAGTDSSYTITEARIQPDWHIAVTFTNANAKKQTVKATYRLDLECFVYKNTEDQERIEGRPVPGVYF
jgi:hypothetical protein